MNGPTRIGLAGAALTALCCLTPALPWLLGGLGATGLLSVVYRDVVLLPLLAVFLAILGVGIWKAARKT